MKKGEMKKLLSILLLLSCLSYGSSNKSLLYLWFQEKGVTVTAKGKENCSDLRENCFSGKYKEWLDEDGVKYCSCTPIEEKIIPNTNQTGKTPYPKE